MRTWTGSLREAARAQQAADRIDARWAGRIGGGDIQADVDAQVAELDVRLAASRASYTLVGRQLDLADAVVEALPLRPRRLIVDLYDVASRAQSCSAEAEVDLLLGALERLVAEQLTGEFRRRHARAFDELQVTLAHRNRGWDERAPRRLPRTNARTPRARQTSAR